MTIEREEPWQKKGINRDWEAFAQNLGLAQMSWSRETVWGDAWVGYSEQGGSYAITLKVARERRPKIEGTISRLTFQGRPVPQGTTWRDLPHSDLYEETVTLDASFFVENILEIPGFTWELDDPFCPCWYEMASRDFQDVDRDQIGDVIVKVRRLLHRADSLLSEVSEELRNSTRAF